MLKKFSYKFWVGRLFGNIGINFVERYWNFVERYWNCKEGVFLSNTEYFFHYGVIKQDMKDALSGLKQSLATKSPLKMMKNIFISP